MATKKTPRKRTPKYVTKPTLVALVVNGKGKPKVAIGTRRIAASAHKGAKVVDQKRLFWSQIRHVRVAKSKAGRLSLSTERAAKAAGLELVG